VESTEVFATDANAPAAKAYMSSREQVEHGIERSPLLAANGTFTQAASILWHPIPGRDGAMGVLGVAWTQPIKRVPETLSPVMEALAAEAAGVIERTTLLLRLETVATLDDATGLPNERAWEEEVPRELSRARRQDAPLSVVLLDLGEFELTPEGSVGRRDAQLLRDAAERWRKDLGPSDFLAHRDPPGRFGVLLPNVGPEDADAAAQRLLELAPEGRPCELGIATWNGIELPAALVGRAELQIELGHAAARAD
jgi:GGDEF domain-containing protein